MNAVTVVSVWMIVKVKINKYKNFYPTSNAAWHRDSRRERRGDDRWTTWIELDLSNDCMHEKDDCSYEEGRERFRLTMYSSSIS